MGDLHERAFLTLDQAARPVLNPLGEQGSVMFGK